MGVLTNLSLNGGDASSLSALVFSSANGLPFVFEYYSPISDSDLVADCSDEYPNCSSNIIDCAGECDGSAEDLGCGCGEDGPSGCDEQCGSILEFDECGICGGGGIADGACDCDGNIDLGCGCGEAGPSGCDEECGSILEFDDCGVCGGPGANIECWNGFLVCDESDCLNEPVNIFFSEYVEGTSTNKALEIYNATGQVVNLDGYEIWKAANGGDWNSDDNELPLDLSGNLIENNDVFVICRSSVPVINECDIIIDGNIHPMNFNGDDAIGLAYGGVLLDVIGEVGIDPGLGWDINGITDATRDHTLLRDLSVNSGSTNWSDSQSGWIVYDELTYDFLGSHSEVLVEGCLDINACNFDDQANIECDLCCEYAQENFDCEGNCIAEIDCEGNCGGLASLITFCEDTDGDGLGNPGTEIEECTSTVRIIEDGCSLPKIQ